MNAETTQKAAAARAKAGRRPQLRRIVRRCEAPRGGRRWLRVCGWSCGGLVGAVLLGAIAIYTLFASGILTADLARPYVARALEQRLGNGSKVEIGSLSAGRDASGGTLLRVNEITVRDGQGEIIASAPQAEVTLQSGTMPWTATPRRIDLVGVELTVHINAQGELSVVTGRNAKPLHAPARQPGDAAPIQGAASQNAPAEGAPAQAETKGGPTAPSDTLPFDPMHLQGLAALADSIDRGGLDGAALTDVGIKDGTLRIESEISGRRWAFEHISIALSRPPAGGMTLDLTSGGTDGPWSAKATIGTLGADGRPVSVQVRDLAPHDLMIAAGKGDGDLIATSPLSFDLDSRIDADGRLVASAGKLVAGAGELQIGADVAGRMVLDEASIAFRFDPARKLMVFEPIAIQSGPVDITIGAEVSPPAQPGEPWRLHATGIDAKLGGGGPDAEKDPPLVIDRAAFDARFEPAAGRLVIEQGNLTGPQAGVTLGGELNLGAAEPFLAMNVSGTPMSATALKRLWPILAAPDVRRWVYDHIIAGDVSKVEINFTAPLNSIGNKDRPLPAEGLSVVVVGTNGVLRPVPGLPPMRKAEVTVEATGRSAHVVANNAVLDTPGGRSLGLPQSVLDIPNTVPKNPAAKVSVKVAGSAAAAIELMSMPPLRGAASEQVDAAGVKGTIDGTAQINLTLREKMTEQDVDFAFEANLAGFSAEKVLMGQKLDAAAVKVFATSAAIVLRGDGKIGGAPASFELRKPRDGGDIDFRLAANIDDAARSRMDLDLAGLSGTIGVKLTGMMNDKVKTADVELDLGAVRLAELVPGWSKPAGKPAKLTAKATWTPSGTRLDDLVVTGSGVNVKGNIALDSKASLISADLPTFQLSDGDKASVKAENVDGAMKVTVRGEVIEARAFLKNLLEAPIAGRKDEKPADIDLDVNLGVVAGNNGEVMRQAVLKLSRRNGDLRAFSLGALVGRDGGVNGELKARDNGRPMLQIATTDAGALLRFIDLYPKIQGGDLWINVDAPRGDGAPQDGVVNMRDFVIRGESGLDRLIAAAPAQNRDGRPAPGAAIAFSKLQVDFQRSQGRLAIRDGAIWGPAIGSTFDGVMDFAGDRVSVRGTYVPAYGLNNIFSKLPVLGFFLGGGPNEGLVGVTYEIVGPMGGPTLRVNPISMVAPGFLRKIFEFRQAPDPTPPKLVPSQREQYSR
ncbi:MAG: hypothetical protein K0R27_1846 [Xanthobacteraceae bacterium]|jgi:hypothetical protein|nr:hypothetical protein [Xanthobacteraceae bacterium]